MRTWKGRLAVSLLIGAAVPLADLALACRDPLSERCVWGKAYLPFSLPFSIAVIGGILFAAFTVVALTRAKT
jgi:hypothetical protein